MKRTLLAALAVLAFTPAMAADLKGAPVAVAEPRDYRDHPFGGMYVGVVAGIAAGQFRDETGFKVPQEGYTAGGLIGYNLRLRSVVVGAEADLSVTDLSGSTNVDGFTIKGSSKVLSTVRARVGLPIGATMFYATGGLAMTNAKLDVELVGADSKNHVRGYVYGAGVESMLLGNMGLRLEALRYQWDGQTFTIDGGEGSLKSHNTQFRAGVVVKLN